MRIDVVFCQSSEAPTNSEVDEIKCNQINLAQYSNILYLLCPKDAHLSAQVDKNSFVFAVISGDRFLILVPLADLTLELGIRRLQGAHLLQVGSQTVVEVLHGSFLVDRHCITTIVAIVTPKPTGQIKTAPGARSIRYADTLSPCPSIDAWCL